MQQQWLWPGERKNALIQNIAIAYIVVLKQILRTIFVKNNPRGNLFIYIRS